MPRSSIGKSPYSGVVAGLMGVVCRPDLTAV
jgi:hypothetical protein